MFFENDDFFEFVNTLNPNEQGQFIKFVNANKRKSEGKLLKLFNSLCDMPAYNEWKAMRAAGYTSKNSLSKGRNLLIHQIYRFLRYLEGKKARKDKNIQIQIYEAVIDILILRERRAFKIAHQRLEDSIKTARRHHLHNGLLALLQIKKTFLRKGYIPNQLDAIESINTEITQIVAQISLESKIIQYYDKIFVREHIIDIEKQKEVLREVIQIFNQENIQENQLTLKAFMAYHFIYAKYYEILEEAYDLVVLHWQKMIAFLEKQPILKNENQERYLNIYNNYFGSLLKAKMLEASLFQKVVSAIDNLKPKTQKIEYKIQQHLLFYQLQYNTLVGNYTNIIQVSPKINQLLSSPRKYDLPQNRTLIFRYHLAAAYFILSKDDTSYLGKAKHLIRTIDEEQSKHKTEVKLKTKLLLAAIAYTEENEADFETCYNAIRYQLRTSEIKKYFITVKDILFTLQKARNLPYKRRVSLFQFLYDTLDENDNFYYKEFKDWVKCFL